MIWYLKNGCERNSEENISASVIPAKQVSLSVQSWSTLSDNPAEGLKLARYVKAV